MKQELVSTLDPKLVNAVRSGGRPRQLTDGEALLRAGDVDERLFFIESGACELASPGKAPIKLSAGCIVNEFAFLDRRPCPSTIKAVGATTVCALSRSDIVRALSDDPTGLVDLLCAISAQMHSRLDDTGGVSDVERLLQDLTRESLSHRAVRHRYLRALRDGTVPDLRWAIADFGRQYFGYSAHFPRYLTTVISRLELPAHRAALLENLTEESGQYGEDELKELVNFGIQPEWIIGIPHPKLFQRFRRALGVEDALLEQDSIEVVCWREMFLSVLSNGSAAEAIGALGLGTEGIVRHLYTPFVQALEKIPDLDPKDTVFFPLHTAVDDHHQETLTEIARHYAQTDAGRHDLAKGMRKALALRASFWDWMYERAMTVDGRFQRDSLQPIVLKF